MTSNQPACSSTHLLSGFDWFKDRRTRTDNHIKIGKKKRSPFLFRSGWLASYPLQIHTVTHSHTTQRLCNKYIVVAVVVIIVAGDVSLFVSLPNHITRGAEMLRIPAGF
jgi:membrane-bound acyltransferase YfiQ involved in biofilm formation